MFISYCFPEGKSLNNLNQDMVDNLFPNINSYIRKVLNDKIPYELVEKKFGKDFLDMINIKKIPSKKVKLTQLI